MSDKKLRVALVGATGAVGEALLEVLAERDFPIAELHALGRADSGDTILFRNRPKRIRALAEFDFSQADLAFFCAGEAVASDAERAVAAGCRVIDLNPRSGLNTAWPLVVAGVNDADLSWELTPHVVAADGLVVQVALALAALADAGLQSIHLTSLEAVSGRGRQGVTELARQTARLLNAQPLEEGLFPAQMAFNVLPQIGAIEADGHTFGERLLIGELRRVLKSPSLSINVTRVQVPVFYGHAAALNVHFAQPLSAQQATDRLAEAGIEIVSDDAPGYPSPVGDSAGQDAVFAGRLRNDPDDPRGLNLWVVADNIRKGAAVNSVQIAEILIKSYR